MGMAEVSRLLGRHWNRPAVVRSAGAEANLRQAARPRRRNRVAHNIGIPTARRAHRRLAAYGIGMAAMVR